MGLWNEGKGPTLDVDIEPLSEGTSLRSAKVWHTLSRISQFYPHSAHPHVYPQIEWAIHGFAFRAKAGPHLPIPVGWKAKLA